MMFGVVSTWVVIKDGIRQRLGDGNKMNIWRDPWMHTSDSPYIKTTPIQGLEHLKVYDLIESKYIMNYELIHDLYPT